jgi:hypothetical protein
VIGVQHVPSLAQTAPVGHWRHVTLPPQPSLTGLHEGLCTFEQSSFAQQVFARHVVLAPVHDPHWSVWPQPSSIVPQLVAPHAFAAQHEPLVLHTSPPGHTVPVQSSVVLVHGSSLLPQSSVLHLAGVQHAFCSGPPDAPHVSPARHPSEQLKTVPVHGSVYEPAH